MSNQLKRCTRCGREKFLTEFRHDKGRVSGYHPWCKACHCKCEHDRKANRPKRITKLCKKCRIEKPIVEFGLKRKGKGIYRQLRVTCRKCSSHMKSDRLRQRREAQNRYRDKNVELIRENQRRIYTKYAAIWKARRDVMKSNAIVYKGGNCFHCGLPLNDENPSFCFDFHHIDMATKHSELGDLLHLAARASASTEKKDAFFRELESCIVLCAICHRKVHYTLGT